MTQHLWEDFLNKGAIYMRYTNNRAVGVTPTTNEVNALIAWRTARHDLTTDEVTMYENLGGPSFLISYLQAKGGGRTT